MAVLRQSPLIRAVHFRALTIACGSGVGTASTVAVPPANKNKQDSRVLLGMSEPDLQQLVVEFGQVCFRLKMRNCYLKFLVNKLLYLFISVAAKVQR